MSPQPEHNRSRRAAAQTVRTDLLLGVPFVPINAEPARDEPAPRAAREADTKRSRPQPYRLPDSIVEKKPAPAPSATGHPLESDALNAIASDDSRSRGERLDALERHYRDNPATAAHAISGWNSIVFHDGSPDAELMFIGEAPGADEDASGTPFVGRAGQKLNEMIKAIGFQRETVYIANVLKVRPPNNRDPSESEVAADGPYLLAQIRTVQPKVIVTLGRPASQFILQTKEAMGRLRGAVHDFNGIPVAPTYHPAFLLRQYTADNRRKVWNDLQLAVAQINNTP